MLFHNMSPVISSPTHRSTGLLFASWESSRQSQFVGQNLNALALGNIVQQLSPGYFITLQFLEKYYSSAALPLFLLIMVQIKALLLLMIQIISAQRIQKKSGMSINLKIRRVAGILWDKVLFLWCWLRRK